MHLLVSIAIAVTVMLVTTSSGANSQSDRLLDAKTLRCTMQTGSMGDWQGSAVAVKTIQWGQDTVLIFDTIDLKAGKARMIGNAGGSDVQAWVSPTGIHFMEVTDSGNFIFTTVFFDSPVAESSSIPVQPTHKLVMSRHLTLSKAPIASQFHGLCAALL